MERQVLADDRHLRSPLPRTPSLPEDLTRLQQQAGIPVRRWVGVTTLRRWVRGESSPNLAGLAILTRLLLGEKANWYTDFIGRGRRVLKELRYYDELESRDE